MKNCWQHFKTWQKALIVFFLVLFIVYQTVFVCSVNFLAKEAITCKDRNILGNVNIFKKENLIKDGDLEIITNKTEYSAGEEVKVMIKNNLDEEIFMYGISATLAPHYSEEKDGEEVIKKDTRLDINCSFMEDCRQIIKLMPKEQKKFAWDQRNDNGEQVESGVYKLSATLGAWDKSALISSKEFIILSSEEFLECKENSDCDAQFVNCDCQYHCFNKGEKIKDCDNLCPPIEPIIPECMCLDNNCVEANDCNKLKSEIKKMIKDMQYCNSGSDCSLDETNHLNCPFGTYLITGIYNSDKNIAVTSIQNKIEEYNNICEACEYEMLGAPEPDDIKCQNNQCVDARYLSPQGNSAPESESTIERLNRLNAQGELTAEDQGWEIEQKCYGLESINDCEKINWPMKCGCRTDGKYECYRCFAELEKNSDYCGKIEEKFWRNNCYWAVAIQLRNAGEQDKINFCGKMTGEARSDNQKGACFEIMKENK